MDGDGSRRSSGGGGGGEGHGVTANFLFGNIDQEGRLEEADYLDYDAREQLGNVASSIAVDNKELNVVASSMLQRGGVEDEEEEDYDEAEEDVNRFDVKHDEGAIDYADEDEVVEEDAQDLAAQKEKQRLVELALKSIHPPTSAMGGGRGPLAASGKDDDENYDEDEADEKSTQAPPEVPAKAMLEADQAFADKTTAPAQGATEPGRTPGTQFSILAPSRKVEVVPFDANETLRFTDMFTLPVDKLPTSPKRRRLGIELAAVGDDEVEAEHAAGGEVELSDDELLQLNAETKPPDTNPVDAFIEEDSEKSDISDDGGTAEDKSQPASHSQSPSLQTPSTRRIAEGETRPDEAAQPLRRGSGTSIRFDDPSSSFSMVQQFEWERQIDWGDGDNDNDDERVASETDNAEKDAVQDGTNVGNGEVPEVTEANESGEMDDDGEPQGKDDWEDVEFEDAEAVKVDEAPGKLPEEQSANSSNSSTRSIGADAVETRKEPTTDMPSRAEEARPTSEVTAAGGEAADGDTEEVDAEAPEAGVSASDPTEEKQTYRITHLEPSLTPDSLVLKPLAMNEWLMRDDWLKEVQWESDSDGQDASVMAVRRKLTSLLLDMNDPNMQIVPLSPASAMHHDVSGNDAAARAHDAPAAGLADKGVLTNGLVERQHDPFNISNDHNYFYSGSTLHDRRVDRQSVLRGLHHSPPCAKARTSDHVPSDEYLISFHRPMLSLERMLAAEKVTPIRRKRPKGGIMQVAGQVPKKRADLSCASKDVYRVYMFEYPLERLPTLLAIPGMACRIVTYARRKPKFSRSAANADSEDTGDAAASASAGGDGGDGGAGSVGNANVNSAFSGDVMYLARDEPPPLYAGDLSPNNVPTSVVESTLYCAPCQPSAPSTCDFLLVRKDRNFYVREIDELVSVGVTEPRLEVMAPNTDRFKRYAHDRVLLWILREFERKKRKGIEPLGLKKNELADEFTRRRTYPQTSLPKILKEVSTFEGGTYIMSEPTKTFGALEAETLRTISPEETCAFESMEAGWEALVRAGIRIFTHPASQGNILGVAEKTGLARGKLVAEHIRLQLLRTPWFRSSQMIDAQRALRTSMNSALTRARAANDLSEGGAAAEARLAQMTSEDCLNLLTSFYRVSQKKIPADIEGRRQLLRSLPMKRGKDTITPELIDFPAIVQDVIAKHRAGTSKAVAVGDAAHSAKAAAVGAAGGAHGASAAGGSAAAAAETSVKIITVEMQLKAFEGQVASLPPDDEKAADAFGAAAAAAARKDAHAFTAAKLEARQREQDLRNAGGVKRSEKPLSEAARAAAAAQSVPLKKRDEAAAVSKDANDSAAVVTHDGSRGTVTKKVKKLKITRRVRNEAGEEITEVRYVTDPVEIEKLKGQQALKRKQKQAAKGGNGVEAGGAATLNGDVRLKGGAAAAADGGNDAGGDKRSNGNLDHRSRNEGSSQPVTEDNPLKVSIGLHKIKAIKSGKGVNSGAGGFGGGGSGGGGGGKLDSGGRTKIGKIKIDGKVIEKHREEVAAKRRRAQYGDDEEYIARTKSRKKSEKATSRRLRNGEVVLNEVLAKVEKDVRSAQGYISETYPKLVIKRVPGGTTPPPTAKNLAKPKDTGLDFTVPVKNVPTYGRVVKEQMYLNLVRIRCTQAPYHYRTAEMFLDDMRLLAHNARMFNTTPETQWVVQHAELLVDVAREKIAENADAIARAEEMIRKSEEAEAAGHSEDADGAGSEAGLSTGGAGDDKSNDVEAQAPTPAVAPPDTDQPRRDSLQAQI